MRAANKLQGRINAFALAQWTVLTDEKQLPEIGSNVKYCLVNEVGTICKQREFSLSRMQFPIETDRERTGNKIYAHCYLPGPVTQCKWK